jgi:hypothetical protein
MSLTAYRKAFDRAAAELNESFARAEVALRARSFATATSIPLAVTRDQRGRRETRVEGQLAWIELDGTWQLVFIGPRALLPLRSAALPVRIAAAHALNDLLNAMLVAEE